MESVILVTRNVLRHVYEALLQRRRLANGYNIPNLQLLYNRLTSEYFNSVPAEKKGQCHVVQLTGQEVDDFYSHRMSQADFIEIFRNKVSHDHYAVH